MPINAFDVTNLNHSMESLGDTFRQRRLDKQKEEGDIQHELIQKQMADAAQSRQERGLTIEQNRLALEQNRGAQEQARGDLQDKQNFLKTVMTLNATGQLQDVDAVNEWLNKDPHFSQMGIQLKTPAQKPAPNVGQSAAAQALQEAARWRAEGNNEYADLLEKVVKQEGSAKTSPGYQTTTVKPELGIDNKATGNSLTNITTRVPLGSPAVAPPPVAPAIPTYPDEASARTAGKQAGDVVTITGVGKVRLK
jgi:hypothetical protein